VPGKAVGRVAVDLPWLCPNTSSLVGLAEGPASLSQLSSADPALFAFLTRFALGDAGSPLVVPNERLVSATLLETAVGYLTSTKDGWLDPSSRLVQDVGTVANRAAHYARTLAQFTERVFPEGAETAARLAPLGWYAVLAIDEPAADKCLRDAAFADNPLLCQQAHWELDHAAIARRLVGRWKLPSWLSQTIGCLNLSLEAAIHLGVDADLFAIVALAVQAAEQGHTNLGLTHGIDAGPLLDHLGIDQETIEAIVTLPQPRVAKPVASKKWNSNPHQEPLIVNLLRSAVQARRRNGSSLVVRLEERIDALHQSAASLAENASERLRDAKLASLAEFAAGAGHEINNPLAVISGNAQRLLRTEQDDDRADTLRTIVRQSQRISGILRELMQFARPPKVEKQMALVLNLVNEVCQELLPLAEARGVRLELGNAAADAQLYADPRQIHTALAAVVRNGIEAADHNGWVRLECSRSGSSLHFTIEDSGAGLSATAAEHAFDPFYSGRIAGRGRGLGLATAWRLVRQNGGNLIHDSRADGPTRFVLSLPAAMPATLPELRSA